jgi:hypothetical protein
VEVAPAEAPDAGAPAASNEPELAGNDPLPVGPDDPHIGPDDALVTLALFGEIRSSWTTMLFDQVESKLLPQFPEGSVRFVWKHLLEGDPPDDEARRVARAAAAVQIAGGSKAFFAFLSAARETKELSEADCEALAGKAGVSAHDYRAALPAADAKIKADAEVSRKLPYPGAWFYVNGRSESVRFSCDTAGTIAAELAKAKQMLDLGVPRAKISAARVRENVKNKAYCVLLKD